MHTPIFCNFAASFIFFLIYFLSFSLAAYMEQHSFFLVFYAFSFYFNFFCCCIVYSAFLLLLQNNSHHFGSAGWQFGWASLLNLPPSKNFPLLPLHLHYALKHNTKKSNNNSNSRFLHCLPVFLYCIENLPLQFLVYCISLFYCCSCWYYFFEFSSSF